MPMTNVHRALVQFLMVKQVVKETEFNKYLIHCKEVYDDEEAAVEVEGIDASPYVRTINEHLDIAGLKIVKQINERDGSRYYGLVSRDVPAEDTIALRATSLSGKELELFKKILKAIIESDNCKLAKHDAIMLRSKLTAPVLTMKASEDVIETLITDKWLHSHANQLQVGLRSIMELQDLLVDEYGAAICEICEEPCFKQVTCGTSSCDKIMHKQCIARFFASNKDRGPRSCPYCRNLWNADVNINLPGGNNEAGGVADADAVIDME